MKEWMLSHILTAILLVPSTCVVLMMLCAQDSKRAVRYIALAGTSIVMALSVSLFVLYDNAVGGMQFVQKVAWMPSWGIAYSVGADGLSIQMIFLNAVVIFTGVLVSWNIEHRVREFYALLIFLATGVFGVFVTTDLFFFALFYEMAVLPMYLLIAIWGSGKNREYAAFKLTLMLFLGSAFVMTGILMLYKFSGLSTFSLTELTQNALLTAKHQKIVFLMFFIGFASIIPAFPIHTWSPEGHACAPTAVSMLHAGVLMKLGGYGLLRIAVPILPQGLHEWAVVMMVLAFAGIVYGAITAIAQDDLKFMIGFSSVSHMGTVLLGISTMTLVGMTGAAFQMVAHGLVTALLFAAIGAMYDRTHTRMISELGGVAGHLPRVAFFFAIAGLASVGLPGFAPFVAELLIFMSAIKIYTLFGLIALGSIVVSAYYMLRAVHKAYWGERSPRWAGIPDMTVFEAAPLVLLLVILLILGIWPTPFVDMMNNALSQMASRMRI